eukprot:216889_1
MPLRACAPPPYLATKRNQSTFNHRIQMQNIKHTTAVGFNSGQEATHPRFKLKVMPVPSTLQIRNKTPYITRSSVSFFFFLSHIYITHPNQSRLSPLILFSVVAIVIVTSLFDRHHW